MFQEKCDSHFAQIWVPSNPKGAERLPPGIIASESDLYMRRLWGNPEEVCFSNTQSDSWSSHFSCEISVTLAFYFLLSVSSGFEEETEISSNIYCGL